MKYDFYNFDNFYKPGLAIKARDRLHRVILKGLKVSGIMEIGIGFGELADYCRRNGIGWVGVDANQQLIDHISNKGFKAYKAIMPEFPDVREDYHVIFAAHFIEHLKDSVEALKFLGECRNRLSLIENGALILLYPDIEKIGHFFWQDYTHSFVTTKKRIEDMMFDSGFKVIRSGRYTSCFFAASGLISLIGRFFPYFLFPKKIAMFLKLSFQQHAFTIGIPKKLK